MPTSPQNTSLENYFYSAQLRKYLIQVMTVFSGLHVAVGKNNFNSETNLIRVPVRYGNSDRVVDAILGEHTQNKPVRIPIIAVNLTGIEMAPEMRKGVGQVERYTTLPRGGSIPDDVKTISKYQPIPYRGNVEVAILASNENQHFQMLEQILMLFDPDMQFQTSDAAHDWTIINKMELININFDTVYPKLEDKRIVGTTFTLTFTFYLSPPADLLSSFVKDVRMRLAAIATTGDVDETLLDMNNYPSNFIDPL